MFATRRAVLAAGAAIGGVGTVRAATPVRAVIELFTSQGCSSCPPADRLMGELLAVPALLVLTLPVDYWDGLGWKDTLAQPEFSQRQRDYAQRRGDREVYTPQAVVNGGDHAVGSDRRGILALTEAGLPARIAILSEAGTMVAQVSQTAPEAELVLAPYVRSRTVAIGRGENARATVTYVDVVQRLIGLGPLAGRSRVPLSLPPGAEAAALLLQQGGTDRPGRILAAAQFQRTTV